MKQVLSGKLRVVSLKSYKQVEEFSLIRLSQLLLIKAVVE